MKTNNPICGLQLIHEPYVPQSSTCFPASCYKDWGVHSGSYVAEAYSLIKFLIFGLLVPI